MPKHATSPPAVCRESNRRELGRAHRTPSRGMVEDASVAHWLHRLPFQRFQALFNSLFKVLCIFPSRYLFAIGLSPIFSFRRNLPPDLSCSPKQLDSSNEGRTGETTWHERDCHPPWFPVPREFDQASPCPDVSRLQFGARKGPRFSD